MAQKQLRARLGLPRTAVTRRGEVDRARGVTAEDDPPQSRPMGDWDGWAAVHDHLPPGAPTLRVHGKCTFPTAGYVVELRRHEPPGADPRDLLLEKVVRAPAGPLAEAVTVVPVNYDEETDVEYDTVTILPDGIAVPVRDVH